MPSQQFTPKQQRFVEFYDGNGTEAARKAGYAGSNEVIGITASKLLRISKVAKAIQQRESREMRPKVADRVQRQQFWTRVMSDPKVAMADRLRASELLGRSAADFLERVQLSTDTSLAERMKLARERAGMAPTELEAGQEGINCKRSS